MITRLRTLIASTGLSQVKFAASIGVTGPEINRILNGKRNLSEGMIGRIVARTGVSEAWLRTGEGEMFATPEPTEQTPYDLAILAGAGELVAEIFSRYCELPQEQKTAFEGVVRALLKAQKTGKIGGSSVAINNVFGDNNTTIH